MSWDPDIDARCHALAGRTAEGDLDAWRELLVAVSGPVEAWAARHPTLRRWRLNGPDDARAVLVRVIERMAANRYQALADYHARRALAAAPRDELARLARLDEVEDEPPGTPFAAWLRTVFRFALLDHVHSRLGWADGGGRRGAGSDAERMSQVTEPGARPAMTDWLTVQQRMQAVEAELAGLPPEMAQAVRAWAEGLDFAEIAQTQGLADAGEARKRVRAGHARLRAALRALGEE
jgi:hypothetical protein